MAIAQATAALAQTEGHREWRGSYIEYDKCIRDGNIYEASGKADGFVCEVIVAASGTMHAVTVRKPTPCLRCSARCDHSPESLALPRCLVMCCAGVRWAVLSRPGVRGTTDDGADEQRVGQVESH